MPTYSVLMQFQVFNSSIGSHFQESEMVKLEAQNADEAHFQAMELGKNEDEIFHNRYGEKIHWRFAEISQVIPAESKKQAMHI